MAATASNITWGPTYPGLISPFRISQWKIKGKKFSNSCHVEEGPNKAFEIQFWRRCTWLSLLLLLSKVPSKESRTTFIESCFLLIDIKLVDTVKPLCFLFGNVKTNYVIFSPIKINFLP